MSTIAKRMRELRAKMRMNQAQFADLVGVSQGTVSKWESGQQEPEFKKLLEISNKTDSNALVLSFYDKEHHLQTKWRGSPVVMKGAITNELSESPFWDDSEHVEIAIPLASYLNKLNLFAMLVKDNSANELFKVGSIVIFAEAIVEKLDPRPGDAVLVSEPDAETGLKRNKIGIWSKRSNEYPILAGVSGGAFQQPSPPRYKSRIEAFANGGYAACGLLGITVGAFTEFDLNRFVDQADFEEFLPHHIRDRNL